MISKVQVKRLSIIKSIYFHFALPVDSSGMAGVQTRGGTRAKAVAKAGGRIRGRIRGRTEGAAQGGASIEAGAKAGR